MIGRRAMLKAMGGLPFTRPDQHYEPPAGGAQIPGARGLVRAREVIIVGTGANFGIFVYTPTAAAGNLISSITAGAGTDPFGNAYLAGVTSYLNAGANSRAAQLVSNSVQFYSAPAGVGPWTLQDSISLPTASLNLTLASFGTNQIALQPGGGATISYAAAAGNALSVTRTVTSVNPALAVAVAALGDIIFGGLVTGDTNNRVSIDTAAGGNPRIRFGPGNAAPDVQFTRVNANQIQITNGDFDVQSTGRGLQVAEGTNAKQGTATLAAGTVTVANTAVTANSRIFLTAQTSGAAPGALRVSARTAGTSFVITSTSATDTSLVAYEIFEPG